MSSERTSEERDAARREREAAREGRAEAENGSSPAKPVVADEPVVEDEPVFQVVPKPRRGGPRLGHSVRARVGAVFSLVLVGIVVWLLVSIFQPFYGAGHGRVVVDIPKGASAGDIASILAKKNVIDSSFFFDIRTFISGSRGDLHSGRFVLKEGMSYSEAIDALRNQVPKAAVVKVLIPEGETRPQIAEIARKDGLRGDYMKASKRASGFSMSRYGARKGTPNLEGFLFPATYELDAHASVSHLVAEQLAAFQEDFSHANVTSARKLHLTPYELLIVASMIEREAMLPHDRPLVAAVIYNRLRRHIALGIDATIRFALNDYDKPLTEAQLHAPSPYNTRLHTGLPPTPISNPGVEAIEAAAHPAHASYLYYVAGADGCGDLVFSNTYAEFSRHSAEYDEALEKNGGNVPTCKRK